MKKSLLSSRWLLTHPWLPDGIAARLLRAAGTAAPVATASIWAESVGSQWKGRRVLRLADMPEGAQGMGILLACSAILHQQIPEEDRYVGNLVENSRLYRLEFSHRGWRFASVAKMLMGGSTLAEASIAHCDEAAAARKISDKQLCLAYPRDVDDALLLSGMLEQIKEACDAESAATVALFTMGALPKLHGGALAAATQAFGPAAAREAVRRHKDELVMFAENLWNSKSQDIGLRMPVGYFEERLKRQNRMDLGMAPGSLADSASVDNGHQSLKWLGTRDSFLGELAKEAFSGEPIAWQMATENKALGILNVASWGVDVNLAGPDGKRPIEVAVDKGRALVFRGLLDAGANASTKGAKARKSPIERSGRMLRSGVGPKLLAAAEKAEMESCAPEPAAEITKAKPRRL